jgi:hypothetical protein
MPYYSESSSALLVASGDKVYKINDDGTTSVLASGFTSDIFDFISTKIQDDECIIFCNGKDPTKVYNGTTVRNLLNRRPVYDESGVLTGYVDGDGNSKSLTDEITTLAPVGRFTELHYERVWTAKDNMVYFSSATVKGFDPDDWTTPTDEVESNQHGGFIDMITNDGSKIVGLKVVFDDVLVFKNKSLFKIFGTYPGNYTKIQLFTSSGAIADKSIVAGQGKAFFLAKDGIFQYDGTNVVSIHEKIRDTFRTINQSAMDKAVGTWYKGKYILAVPEGSSTENNLVIEYSPVIGAFMFVRGITVNHFAEFEDKLLYADNSGNLYEYGTGSTFNGTAINMAWETGLNSRNQNGLKNIETIYFIGNGNGKVRITCITERGERSTELQLTGTDAPYKPKLKHKGRLIRFRFENVDGSYVEIKSPQSILEIDFD